MEKLPIRLENAVTKLYNAFHAGELNPMDCRACAVGNICDNQSDWRYTGYHFNAIKKSSFKVIEKTGYSLDELLNIEFLFMYGVMRDKERIKIRHDGNRDKESQYKGLCKVVEYLCKLDNVPNIMDIQSLFDYEDQKPKYSLDKLFI